MNSADSQPSRRGAANPTRVLIIINYLLFFLLISPVGRNREFYKGIRAAGLAPLVTTTLPLWVIGTTLFVTALFLWRMVKRSNAVAGRVPRNATLDGVLLLVWWIVLILACLYAFMMGMGG
jgi:hypothetical protein